MRGKGFQQVEFKAHSETILGKYMAVPEAERASWLQAQDWFKKLPSGKNCPFCDGTRQLFTQDYSKVIGPCICTVPDKPERKVTPTNEYVGIYETLKDDDWEGWPPPTFDEIWESESFIPTDSILAAQKVWDCVSEDHSNGKGLILTGANGRGKTLAGMMLLKQAGMAKMQCAAARFADLISMRRRGGDEVQKFYKRLNWLCSRDILMLDEIGKESKGGNPDHVRELLENVIDGFFRSKKTLILTSNMTKQELSSYLPTTCLSRISRDAGWCTVVEEPLDQPDLRGTEI